MVALTLELRVRVPEPVLDDERLAEPHVVALDVPVALSNREIDDDPLAETNGVQDGVVDPVIVSVVWALCRRDGLEDALARCEADDDTLCEPTCREGDGEALVDGATTVGEPEADTDEESVTDADGLRDTLAVEDRVGESDPQVDAVSDCVADAVAHALRELLTLELRDRDTVAHVEALEEREGECDADVDIHSLLVTLGVRLADTEREGVGDVEAERVTQPLGVRVGGRDKLCSDVADGDTLPVWLGDEERGAVGVRVGERENVVEGDLPPLEQVDAEVDGLRV